MVLNVKNDQHKTRVGARYNDIQNDEVGLWRKSGREKESSQQAGTGATKRIQSQNHLCAASPGIGKNHLID